MTSDPVLFSSLNKNKGKKGANKKKVSFSSCQSIPQSIPQLPSTKFYTSTPTTNPWAQPPKSTPSSSFVWPQPTDHWAPSPHDEKKSDFYKEDRFSIAWLSRQQSCLGESFTQQKSSFLSTGASIQLVQQNNVRTTACSPSKQCVRINLKAASQSSSSHTVVINPRRRRSEPKPRSLKESNSSFVMPRLSLSSSSSLISK